MSDKEFVDIGKALLALSPQEQRAALQKLRRTRTTQNMIEPAPPPLPTPPPPPPPPSPRRPRRTETVTCRVRVESIQAIGRAWRQLDIASDLYLDEVQDLLQAAFGWRYDPSHQFTAGYSDGEIEYYLCPSDYAVRRQTGLAQDEMRQDEVRLDEVLAVAGDELFHRCGTRNEWQRVLRLEAVREFTATSPRAVCVDAPKGLDIEATNLSLSSFGQGDADESPIDTYALPDALGLLLGGRPGRTHRELRREIKQAMLDRPITIDPEAAADAMRPYLCLLAHIGDTGMKLTETGNVPAHTVALLFAELEMNYQWLRRPGEPVPISHLRRTADTFGLTEQSGNRLMASELGLRLAADPVALWWHIAERVPRTFCDQMTVLFMLGFASGNDHPEHARYFHRELWRTLFDYEPSPAVSHYDEAVLVFECLRMTPRDTHSHHQIRHPASRMFARAVLQRWPRGGPQRWPRAAAAQPPR